MKQWIKFSTDIHKDIKMWKMSKNAQLVFFYLLSVAGKYDKGGELPPFKDLKLELWFLKLSDKALQSAIDELAELGIVEENSDGNFSLANFEKWQNTNSTGYERVKRYRENHKNIADETQMITDDNADDNVTNETQMITIEKNRIEKNRIDKELEKNREEEKEKNKKVGVADATSAHTKICPPCIGCRFTDRTDRCPCFHGLSSKSYVQPL